MKKLLLTAIAALATFGAGAQLTLEHCLDAARDNYPLIKKYELVQATTDVELSDINRGWLPRIGVYAQGTVQNVVPSFPETLTTVMQQMGSEMKGLGKLQYKAGVDLTQTVWDGGASASQRSIARSKAEVSQAALEVDMYGIRSRVESLYFGILLISSQIEQTQSTIGVFEANLNRLKSLKTNGVAMQADVDMLEAQLLGMRQQLTQAKAAESSYRKMLGIFIGENVDGQTLARPSAEIPAELSSERPELALLDSREALNKAQQSLATVSVMPKIGVFAQAYYGYPGIDYFKAMTSRDLTFNIVAGLKVSWNIDSFYTKKNTARKLDLANEEIAADRETFLFNTSMQTASKLEEIRGIREAMASDARIVQLRENVRRAAEAQLENGTIDATALTTKINDENQAALTAAYHEIQLLQNIYNLKNTLNR